MSQTVEGTGEPPRARSASEASASARPVSPQDHALTPGFVAVSRPSSPSRKERLAALRKTRVVVRRVGPVSVLKLSLVFYTCIMLIVFFGLLILYGFMAAAGVTKNLADLIAGFGLTDAEKGQFAINAAWVFTRIFAAGCLMVVVASLINVIAAFLYNLISDMIGGLEVTLAEKRFRV